MVQGISAGQGIFWENELREIFVRGIDPEGNDLSETRHVGILHVGILAGCRVVQLVENRQEY
jgi:hypothetical protein